MPLDSPDSVPDISFDSGAPSYFDGIDYREGDEDEKLIYVSSSTNELLEPALQIWRTVSGTHLHLTFCDDTQFWLDRSGKTIWALWPHNSSLENTTSYLLGPVLGLLLRLRGITCLHASSVNLNDRSVALVGSEGAGKSTTAAAFVKLGYPGISDDIVALQEQGGCFRVAPAYPYMALWPDSADILYGVSEQFTRISPDWEKRRIPLGSRTTKFEERSLLLGAIYILGRRRSGPTPFVRPISEQAALLALVANSYATNILDAEMRAQEFKVLSRIVSVVPVRYVSPHQDLIRIGELCEVIHRDFEKLGR